MSEVEWLLEAAQEFGPASDPRKAGELRLYLRDNLDAVMKVKDDRKLSWGQVATILTKRGLTKKNGDPLDANIVAVTASAVRLERNPRGRKRRAATPARAGKQAATPASHLPPAGLDPVVPPPATVQAETHTPPPSGSSAGDDDRDEAERAAKLRAVMARAVRKPFPAGAGFEVPTDPNWRKGE
ncbi:hypothetical protein D9599_19280 [Roseomonas sp. KE2513]|uniref:hypothetical protein n=1 Tax=Roseomonas sp. KE2513 TaxID=2479202 RepID=UPI0018E03727|nr:hypothetical protein [Roseomonas sp. KE2513]MBI0537707.1 hypothetical protein [Roseomonas sp. KE2513]